ncbi:hypothetical protein C1H46_009490 [Malus baccata]|uniref:Pectate lyase domain-containing protein n=1 Tax=Malus baccata TaxID=106549 RepID=A0A540N1E2_MALBA|nr:hypothetical protein C1H46_009490 [Malus baccata]
MASLPYADVDFSLRSMAGRAEGFGQFAIGGLNGPTPRIRVTIHHCFFDETRQRQPRLRFGKVHLYNNYTRNGAIYAVSQIYSHCNIYEAGNKKKTFEYHTEKAADREVAKAGFI